MKKGSWSVLFACAFGACIGALCALEISTYFKYGSYFWGIGAFLGGLFAYIAVDFRQLCFDVARSYRVSVRSIAGMLRVMTSWRPYKLYWKAILIEMLGYGTVAISLVSLFFLIRTTGPEYMRTPSIGLLVLAVIPAMFGVFTPAINTRSNWSSYIRIKRYMSYDEYLLLGEEASWSLIKFCNPITLPFIILWLVWRLTLKVVGYLWKNKVRAMSLTVSAGSFTGKEAYRFIVRTFVYVHSERRTICFVDATLGAAFGFLLGSAILGAMIGAVLGIINYEIVSVRWLRLIPKK